MLPILISTVIVSLVSASAVPANANSGLPTFVATIKVDRPAMVFLKSFESTPKKKELFVASFDGNPFSSHDVIYHSKDIASQLAKGVIDTPTAITPNINWGNGVLTVPKRMFGQEGIVVPGGFLVKGGGAIYFSPRMRDGSMGSFITLFESKKFFYHAVHYYDVDQDGHLDILTCRASKGMRGGPSFALTWLEPKDRSNPTGEWEEHVLAEMKGCDTYFTLEDLDGDGIPEIVATLFWGKRVEVTSTRDPSGRFDDPSKLTHTVVDSKLGKAFGIEFADINGDGQKDLLVTNHEDKFGSLFAYTFDKKSYKNPSSWKRHVLADRIKTVKGIFSIGAGSPGSPFVFYPKISASSGKPSIAIAGDGSQAAYIVTPNSESSDDWSYTRKTFHECGNTVGRLAVGDADNDGYTDIFVPCFGGKAIHVYSFAP